MRSSSTSFYLLLFSLPLLIACAKKESGAGDASSTSVTQERAKAKAGRTATSEQKKEASTAQREGAADEEKEIEKQVGRKLIREGFLKYEVDSISREEERIERILEEMDGYVADQKLKKQYERKVVHATLRVPAEQFKPLVERISQGVDGLDDKKVEVKDVTRKFIDLKARLETKKDLELRYKELLKETDSVDEILRIEKEIQGLREEIESIEGQLRHLKDRISMSTLEVEYYREIEREDERSSFRFWNKVSAAAQGGWRGFQWLLIGLVAIWPLLVILGLGTFLGIRAYRVRKKKKRRSSS